MGEGTLFGFRDLGGLLSAIVNNLKRHQLQGPQVLLRSHTSKAPLKGLKGH